MFKKTLRRGVVQVLAVVEIVVYLLLIKGLGTTFIIDGQVSKTAQVVA
jgi:hypothetical protein